MVTRKLALEMMKQFSHGLNGGSGALGLQYTGMGYRVLMGADKTDGADMGGDGGGHTGDRVFQYEALDGGHACPFGSFQKDIGRGLAVFDILIG